MIKSLLSFSTIGFKNLVYSSYSDHLGPLIASRNAVMNKALFAGSAINFNIKGSTNRRAGRFISIDRNNPYSENDFDSKILGQYFITNVTHTITGEGYENNILGVKPYYFSKVDFNNDIK